MPSILVVDDEQSIIDVVEFRLAESGFEVETALSGHGAMKAMRAGQFDLVVLDLNIPDVVDLRLFHDLRGMQPGIPIIMLTARDDKETTIRILEAGADDYITKPFDWMELVARIHSVLRRSRASKGEVVDEDADPNAMIFGVLRIEPEHHQVFFFGEEVEVSANEFKIIRALASHPRTKFPRDRLIDIVYDMEVAVTDRSIDTAVKRIRQKFGKVRSEPDPIVTHYGIGYQLNRDLEQAGD